MQKLHCGFSPYAKWYTYYHNYNLYIIGIFAGGKIESYFYYI